MRGLLDKYAAKLARAGLAPDAPPEHGGPLLAGLDDELVWNLDTPRPFEDRRVAALEPLFEKLSINSLVLAQPPEPHAGIIAHLAQEALFNGGANAAIQPQDCETRTFLHDLPVVETLDTDALLQALSRRKGVIVLRSGSANTPTVLAHGSVSPEQGFVTVSSICFACFVKFFADALFLARQKNAPPPSLARALKTAVGTLPPLATEPPRLMPGPFRDVETVYLALIEAGLATVEHRLVDSYFGNISYLHDEVLYISQTGSSLDELAGHIDPCPLDGGSTAGLTASSELSAHLDALARSGAKAMLHGHPPFSVILSLDCPHLDCPNKGRCHLDCREAREACGTPIVPGEVGTGPFGLCHTLPPALERSSSAIVHGHGVFALGREDFNQAFASLLRVERDCREACLQRLPLDIT